MSAEVFKISLNNFFRYHFPAEQFHYEFIA